MPSYVSAKNSDIELPEYVSKNVASKQLGSWQARQAIHTRCGRFGSAPKASRSESFSKLRSTLHEEVAIAAKVRSQRQSMFDQMLL